MKARIKRYGQVIDVVPVETRMETDGIHTYYTEAGSEKLTSLFLWKDTELDFNVCELSKQDWSSFRREAAKDILCALVGNKDYLKVIGRIEPETMLAIRFADELIKQFKEEKK